IPSPNTGWRTRPNMAENGELWFNNDSSKGIMTQEDPGFGTPTELDLTDSKFGGQNFKPTGTISSSIGDPRWL
ncbi:MAG: hypothetical protein J6R73_02640, partial [Alistipes sp.]|nr:hypothetical protein [Alistipes sp.]